MNWGSIKTALNSTLGTASFLPLDKMIENAKTYLSNKIDNNQANIINNFEKVAVSTTGTGKVLKTTTITENQIGYYSYILEKFVPPVSGLYKVTIDINYSVSGDLYSPHFGIWNIPVKRAFYASKASDDSSSGNGFNYSITTKVCDTWHIFMNNNIGRCEGFGLGEDIRTYIATKLGEASCGYSKPYPRTETHSFYFLCEAGVPVVLYAEDINSNYSSKYIRNIHTIKTIITYGNS